MLTEGQSRSCGCLQREAVTKSGHNNRKHGEGNKTPEYRAWAHMKDRCYNTNGKRYHEWGGRGIRISKRWLDSYANFLEDMDRRPSPKHTLHRLNNDADYSPGNCIWSSAIIQTRNRRGKYTRLIEVDGKIDSISGHCRTFGLDSSLFSYHLRKGREPQAIADYLRLRHRLKTSESKYTL
jgi:hypothetical protein